MTRKRFFIPAAAFLILLSGLAGALSTTGVRATTIGAYLWMNPGGGYDYLNCGWHTSCYPGQETSGVALDFENDDGDPVYFRGFGERTSGGAGNVGTGDPIESNNSCYRVRVHIEDPNGTFQASAIYVHTEDTDQPEFDIAGGSIGNPAYTEEEIGDTIHPDLQGCGTTGAHLHQFGEDFDSRHTSGYPGYVNPGSYTASSLSNWINNEYFTFNE